jgi:transcriptional regulator with XRE-family HTH domain
MAQKASLLGELKARREALGWELVEVGERVGLCENALEAWECGSLKPQIDDVERWADALGLKLGFITGGATSGRGMRVDWAKHCVTVDGSPVRLTPMEWKALERLAWAPGQLVTHQDLFKHLYGTDRDYRAQSTAVRVLITKLRRLLPLRIEAQWRRGYVVNGLEPSRPPAPGSMPVQVCSDTVVDHQRPARKAAVSQIDARQPLRERPAVLSFGSAAMRQMSAPQAKQNIVRSEELGVIERFLAERGATRCPDVATIQHQPLPTLVWDKVKRKWVRPSEPTAQAS